MSFSKPSISIRPLTAADAASPTFISDLTDMINKTFDEGEADLLREDVHRTNVDEVRAIVQAGNMHGAFIAPGESVPEDSHGKDNAVNGVELSGTQKDIVVNHGELQNGDSNSSNSNSNNSNSNISNSNSSSSSQPKLVGSLRVQPYGSGPPGSVPAHPEDSPIPLEQIAEMGMLSVPAAYRRDGIGRMMSAYAEALAKQSGYKVMLIELLVPVRGTHYFKDFLQKWYLKLGYVEVKRMTWDEFLPHKTGLAIVESEFIIYEKSLV